MHNQAPSKPCIIVAYIWPSKRKVFGHIASHGCINLLPLHLKYDPSECACMYFFSNVFLPIILIYWTANYAQEFLNTVSVRVRNAKKYPNLNNCNSISLKHTEFVVFLKVIPDWARRVCHGAGLLRRLAPFYSARVFTSSWLFLCWHRLWHCVL